MDAQEIADKVKDAPESVRNCAMVDKVFYEKGACELGSAVTCPFQSRKYKITRGTEELPACERYHPKLQK